MNLETLREEYDLARRYTESLYADLSQAEMQWRPEPKSSSIAWHLGHQAAVTHLLLRNLIAGEPSFNPQFDTFFDAANPQEERGQLPEIDEIIAYRDAVAARTHSHLASVLDPNRDVAHDATQQVSRIIAPIVVSLINHEYQHDCWIREMRDLLGRSQPDHVLSGQVRLIDGYWGLQVT